jgi:hypothetical protein
MRGNYTIVYVGEILDAFRFILVFSYSIEMTVWKRLSKPYQKWKNCQTIISKTCIFFAATLGNIYTCS